MPIEIREISICMTLLSEGEKEGSAEEEVFSPQDRQGVVDECVAAVLQILRDRKEP